MKTTRIAVPTLFFVIHASFALAQGPVDPTGNFRIEGATRGQRQVRGIWEGIGKVLRSCVSTRNACGLAPDELALAQSIAGQLAGDRPSGPISFVSGRASPGTFDSNAGEVHRIAHTGGTPDSPVLFNSDLIDSPLIPPSEAIGIIIHELGHHAGGEDTADRPLDRLGAKVARWFDSNSQRLSLADSGHPEFEVLFFQPPSGKWTEILLQISDAAQAWELSSAKQSALVFGCDAKVSHVSNLRWSDLGDWNPDEGIKRIRVLGELQADCTPNRFFELRLALRTSARTQAEGWAKGQITWIPELTSVSATEDPEDVSPLSQDLKIIEVRSDQKSLRGGQTWRITAVVENTRPQPLLSCGGNFTSDDFNVVYGSTHPFTLVFDRCTLKDLGNNRFELKLEHDFPASTPPRKYRLLYLGLEPKSQPGGFLLGSPTFVQEVNVESDAVPPPITLKSIDIVTRNHPELGFGGGFTKQYAVDAGETFVLKISLAGASRLIDAQMRSLITLTDNLQGEFTGPLADGTSFTLSERQTPTADGLDVEYVILLPREFGGKPLMGLKFMEFSIMTDRLQTTRLRIPDKELAVYFWDIIQSRLPKP